MAKLINQNTFRSISTYLNLDALLYYHKGNFIQAHLEALVTFYFSEVIIIFLFIEKSVDANLMMYITFVPLFLCFIVCIGYTFTLSKIVTMKLLKLVRIYAQENSVCSNLSDLYRKIDKGMKKTFFWIHVSGTFCYTVVATVSSFAFVHEAQVNNSLPLIITVLGLAIGSAWNILGYNGDRIVDWSCLVKKLTPLSAAEKKVLYLEKFRNYKTRIFTNIIIMCFIVISTIAILAISYFKNIGGTGDTWDIPTIYLFISLFAAAIVLYSKQIVTHFYLKKGQASCLSRLA